MTIRPFTVEVPDAQLDDLRTRIRATRWPDQIPGSGWDFGTDSAYLRELLAYWADGFDWRAQEERINGLPNFTTTLDGLDIHFIHARGGGKNPMPLLLLHGWPSTFLQMTRILPLLTDGGDDSFDVVVPSLPGYGFSSRPAEAGWSVARIAGTFAKLMTGLGYSRYAVRSSDIGAGVALALPPQAVIGQHMSGTNPWLGDVPDDLSDREQAFVTALGRWKQEEFAYAQLHTTKPQTLAFALNDSPAGLAAWIVEKFRSWTDCDGDVERVWSKDDLLSNLTIYWTTETIGSSVRLYAESMRGMLPAGSGDGGAGGEESGSSNSSSWDGHPGDRGEATGGGSSEWAAPPTAVAMFPKDMIPTPREFADRTWPADRWTDMPRGGHFGEWEEPELLADDIREFFRPLRERD